MTEIGPRLDAHIKGLGIILSSVLTSIILYYSVTETPTLKEYLSVSGPMIISSLATLNRRAPKDVWDRKNDRRSNNG